jgi:hypothetical protein
MTKRILKAIWGDIDLVGNDKILYGIRRYLARSGKSPESTVYYDRHGHLHVDMSYCKLKSKDCKLFEHLHCHILNLMGNHEIRDEGFKYLETISCHELILRYCGTGVLSCKYLENVRCTNLDIRGNNIHGGCEYLVNGYFNVLDASACAVEDMDCKHLGKMRNCHELYLTDNKIGNEGCKYLAIEDNKKLYLNCNNIDGDGYRALALGIYNSLNVRGNKIDSKVFREVKHMRCRMLYALDGGDESDIVSLARKNWYLWAIREWDMTEVLKNVVSDYCNSE